MRCARWGTMLLVLVTACGSATPAPTDPAVGGSGVEAKLDAVAEPAPLPLPPLPGLSTAPVPRPDAVMAVAVVPDPTALLRAIAAYADTAKPGLGAELTLANIASTLGPLAELTRVVDANMPLRIVVLEPHNDNAIDSFVVVASVTENADINEIDHAVNRIGLRAQRRDNHVVIGTPTSLKVAADYAMTTLVTQLPPANVTVSVWPREGLLTRFESAITSTTSQFALESIKWMNVISGFKILQGEVVLAGPGGPTVTLTAVAEEGGKFAAFAAGQRASDFAILPNATPAMMTFGGTLDYKVIADWFTELATVLGSTDLGKPMRLFGNTFAGSVSYDPVSQVSYTTSSSLKKSAISTKSFLALVDYISPSTVDGAIVTRNSSKYRSVLITTVTTAYVMPVEQGERDAVIAAHGANGIETASYALVNRRFIKSTSLTALKAYIDRNAGKEKPAVSTTVQTAIDEAKVRGDSALFLIDSELIAALTKKTTSGVAAQFMTLGLGFRGSEIRLHADLPLSFIASLMSMKAMAAAP